MPQTQGWYFNTATGRYERDEAAATDGPFTRPPAEGPIAADAPFGMNTQGRAAKEAGSLLLSLLSMGLGMRGPMLSRMAGTTTASAGSDLLQGKDPTIGMGLNLASEALSPVLAKSIPRLFHKIALTTGGVTDPSSEVVDALMREGDHARSVAPFTTRLNPAARIGPRVADPKYSTVARSPISEVERATNTQRSAEAFLRPGTDRPTVSLRALTDGGQLEGGQTVRRLQGKPGEGEHFAWEKAAYPNRGIDAVRANEREMVESLASGAKGTPTIPANPPRRTPVNRRGQKGPIKQPAAPFPDRSQAMDVGMDEALIATDLGNMSRDLTKGVKTNLRHAKKTFPASLDPAHTADLERAGNLNQARQWLMGKQGIDASPLDARVRDLELIGEANDAVKLGGGLVTSMSEAGVRGGTGAGMGRSVATLTGLPPGPTSAISGLVAQFGAPRIISGTGLRLGRLAETAPTLGRASFLANEPAFDGSGEQLMELIRGLRLRAGGDHQRPLEEDSPSSFRRTQRRTPR